MGGSWVARLGMLVTLVTTSTQVRMYRGTGKLLRTFAYKGGGGGSKSMKMMRTYLMDGP